MDDVEPGVDRDRLAAAKLWLISEPRSAGTTVKPADLPYLAHALFALVPVASEQVETMAADERWRLYVNPTWLLASPVEVIGAELLHAVWHLLTDHAGRARAMEIAAGTAAAWKRASDVAVQHTLAEVAVVNDLPSASSAGLPLGLTVEEYFAALSGLPVDSVPGGAALDPELPPGCGSACDGLPRPHELPPDVDLARVDEFDAAQIRRNVAIAYQGHCTERGIEPGDAGRWAKRVLEPQIAWEPLLGIAVRQAAGWASGHTHYTYRRRSRRQSAVPNILLPGTRRPLPDVAMIIDTSASIDDTLLGRALGEVDGALRALGVAGESVRVLAVDAAVHAVSTVRDARNVRLTGGGGTDLRVGFTAVESFRPRPDLLVVFTDGYTPWPETAPPGTAVVVALLGRAGDPQPPTPPWAIRVDCLLL